MPLGNEGRRHLDGVGTVAHVNTLFQAFHGNFIGAACRLTGVGFDGDPCGQAKVADIGHVLRALQAVYRVLKMRGQGLDAVDHVLSHQDVQHRNTCCAGHGVCGVGVAVGEFQHVVRSADGHEGVVNVLLGHHHAQRLRAVGDLFGRVQNVGCDAEGF